MEILFMSSEYQSEVAKKQRAIDNKKEKTTKAALCPNCKKFHLVASISAFNESRETRKDFAELLIDGFEIMEVTTKEAKAKFGICEKEVGKVEEIDCENLQENKPSRK